MNANVNVNVNAGITYDKSLELFKINQLTLPEKIKWKLTYIANIINNQQIQSKDNLPLEYQMQIQDLKDVTPKGLKIIFTSIIQTLFSEQIPIDKQCLIRMRGFFKSWTDGFIKYDDSYIYFNASNKTSRYRFRNIDLGFNSSSKRAFDFFYKGEELMTVKFEKPESMIAMFKTIKSFIYKQRNNYDQELIKKLHQVGSEKPKRVKQQQQHSKKQTIYQCNINNNRNQQSIKHAKKPSDNFDNKQLQNQTRQQNNHQHHHHQHHQRMQFQQSILSHHQSSMILRNSRNIDSTTRQFHLNPVPQPYIIKHTSKKMFLAVHKQQPKLSLQIILRHPRELQLHQLLSCLCIYKNWNSRVVRQEVCFQMKYEQKAIIYRVYERGSSLLSKPRETYTMLEYKTLTPTTAIVLEESLQNQDRQEEYVRAYLKALCFIETFDDTLKICIQSEFHPKGYCSTHEAQELLVSMYRDVVHFENYLSEYSIKSCYQHKRKDDMLFEEMQGSQGGGGESVETVDVTDSECDNNNTLGNHKIVSRMQFQMSKSSDQGEEQQAINKTQQIYRRSTRRNPFLQLKPHSPASVPTLQFMQLIRKNYHENHCHKHHHTSSVLIEFDNYIPSYCLQQLLRKGGEYEVTQNQELKFINEKLIQSQKDILRFLIKQIGANLISGKSVLNVSLPVDIFEARTLLERSAASFGKCPDYLIRSCIAGSLQQIMNVTAFIASVPTLELVMQKPFNPILGETFQCYLKGIPLCYEQISHHPPISAYYMECPQFKLYGNLIAFADVGLNSGVGGNLGVMHIVFKNGYHYECHFPPSQISGLIYGDRKFRSYGRGYIIERSQSLFAEFSIEKHKKGLYESKEKLLPGSIIGGIYKVNRKFIQLLSSYNDNLKKFPGVSKDHIVQKLVHISGMWFDKIYMNNSPINENIRAYPVQYYPYSLPSDANFRLDVLYHKQNNLPQSQREKQVLQNIQREDRKAREKKGRK